MLDTTLPKYRLLEDTRHGKFRVRERDQYVGRSLIEYGEYCEYEVMTFAKMVKEGDTVIEVGSNIGAQTVPLARMVGEKGHVIAFEPQLENYKLLCENLMLNELFDRVDARQEAVMDQGGRVKIARLNELGHDNYGRVEVGSGSQTVKAVKLDALKIFGNVTLLKIDAEGSEHSVLQGAKQLVDLHRPFICVENDRPDKSAELIAWFTEHRYRCFWRPSPLFREWNYNGNKKNVFGNIVALNMICVPEEMKVVLEGCEEVQDLRDDDEMFNRELARWLRLSELRPKDLDARLVAAHYASLTRNYALANDLLDQNLAIGHEASTAIKGLWALQRGEWEEGWKGYELRGRVLNPHQFGAARDFGVPKWDGQPTSKTLLITHEQGFGDMIMFSRFVYDAALRAPNVIVEVPGEMHELFNISLGFIPPSCIVRRERDLPHYDLFCPVASLPAVMQLNSNEELTREAYLSVDEGLIASWKRRNKAKIGICLKGSPRSERPMTRDMPMELFEPLVMTYGPMISLEQEGQFDGFADTAALMKTLDLVITVDTSVAHLAGALGVPVWLMLSYDPDWRWGLSGETTVWYPSMRIFRQPKFRDWASVIENIDEALSCRQP